MRIHEFGREHEKTILLIHPAAARWDYFSGVIPLLALLIPALPGYNEAAPKEDYTSVEEIAESLADWLLGQGLNEVDVGYGCAMGGSILLAMLAKGRVHILTSVLDGGITPGTLPQPLGRLLAAGTRSGSCRQGVETRHFLRRWCRRGQLSRRRSSARSPAGRSGGPASPAGPISWRARCRRNRST